MTQEKRNSIRLLLSLVLVVVAVIVTSDLKLRFAVLRPWDTVILVAWMCPVYLVVLPGRQLRLTVIPLYAAFIAAAGVYDWLRQQPAPLVAPTAFGLVAAGILAAGALVLAKLIIAKQAAK